MRTAIYARYSSDLQRDASIEDQVRSCKERIEKEGWALTATYTDHAISGSVRLRPGYQKLLEDAREGLFDAVIAEALDRLSRDQEDLAGLYKQLTFAGIRLITLAEGEVSELHVGLKGTMNALFLKDLAQKVRRGLEGRVREGRSGGGLCFGYDVERQLDIRGETSVLSGLKTHLMHPDLVKEFIAEYHRELNRMNARTEETHSRQKDELARIQRQIQAIVEAIKDGMRTPAMRDELASLENRKLELATAVSAAPAKAVRLHPNLAQIYRDKVARLHEELNRPELREEASAAIRSLIEEVRLVPVEGKLEIELAGALAGILALASNNPRRTGRGLQVTLVAGVGFEPTTFRL
jgi:DNA invertase Pin-like site-specific DNA recombinase